MHRWELAGDADELGGFVEAWFWRGRSFEDRIGEAKLGFDLRKFPSGSAAVDKHRADCLAADAGT